MITLVLILISLLLGYGSGFVHSRYLDQEELDYPQISWWNPLIWSLLVVGFFAFMYQNGWKAAIEELKDAIKEINNNQNK